MARPAGKRGLEKLIWSKEIGDFVQTRITRVCEHFFEFVLTGYKGYDFYVSEMFAGEFDFPVYRQILVQFGNKEALYQIPFFEFVDFIGFNEDELWDLVRHFYATFPSYFSLGNEIEPIKGNILSREDKEFLGKYIKEKLPKYFQPWFSSGCYKDPEKLFSDYEVWSFGYQLEGDIFPDWTFDMASKMMEEGKTELRVYSVFPIEKGIPVSPSRKRMEDFGTHIYSKMMDIHDIAWHNGDIGQALK